MAFDKTVEKEVVLANPGKVAFPFRVKTHSLTRLGVLEVAPTKGTLQAGERVTLRLQITAGIPDRIDEYIALEVAHFEPIRIAVVGEGIYQSVALSLPRNVDDAFAPFLEEARRLLRQEGPRASLPASLREGVQLPPKTAAGSGRSAGSRPTTAAAAAASRGSGRQVPAATLTTRGGKLSTTPTLPLRGDGLTSVGEGVGKGAAEGAQYAPSPAEVEHEADRLCLKADLLRREQEKADKATARKESAAAAAAAAAAGGPAPPAAAPSGSRRPSGRSSNPSPPPPVVVSRYVYDFGHVVKGTSRHKRFRMQNVGAHQVIFSWDKSVLAAHGFSVSPDVMPKLPGAPEYESTDVTLTLNTALDVVANGIIDVTVPLLIKGGPRALVTLRANVTTPELDVSAEVLDFASVQVGHIKAMHVQLRNDKSVPCEWSVVKPPKKKERGVVDTTADPFIFTPSRGTLQPGERKNVKVQFTPLASSPKGVVQKTSIQVKHNKQLTVLTCQGTGHTLAVRCDPAVLDLGAVLPGVPDTTAAAAATRSAPAVQERIMWLVNDSAVDVEVQPKP